MDKMFGWRPPGPKSRSPASLKTPVIEPSPYLITHRSSPESGLKSSPESEPLEPERPGGSPPVAQPQAPLSALSIRPGDSKLMPICLSDSPPPSPHEPMPIWLSDSPPSPLEPMQRVPPDPSLKPCIAQPDMGHTFGIPSDLGDLKAGSGFLSHHLAPIHHQPLLPLAAQHPAPHSIVLRTEIEHKRLSGERFSSNLGYIFDWTPLSPHQGPRLEPKSLGMSQTPEQLQVSPSLVLQNELIDHHNALHPRNKRKRETSPMPEPPLAVQAILRIRERRLLQQEARRQRRRPMDQDRVRGLNSGKRRVSLQELGHHFTGFVSPYAKQFHARGVSELFARNIYALPIPPQLTRRLIMYVDASVRFFCGAVGVVWQKLGWTNGSRAMLHEFEGKGAFFPASSDDTTVLELFAIATALRFALEDIDKAQADLVPGNYDYSFFEPSLGQTNSHAHSLKKELFVFSDHFRSLCLLDGTSSYAPEGDVADQVADICALSHTLHEQGIHVELHLSPGHCGIPGNVAAHNMSRKYQRDLAAQTRRSWPTT